MISIYKAIQPQNIVRILVITSCFPVLFGTVKHHEKYLTQPKTQIMFQKISERWNLGVSVSRLFEFESFLRAKDQIKNSSIFD